MIVRGHFYNDALDYALLEDDRSQHVHYLAPRTPERDLWFAVLDDALRTVRLGPEAGRNEYRDALRWVESDTSALGARSFTFVCEHLGFDPAWLRAQIREVAGTGRVAAKSARAHRKTSNGALVVDMRTYERQRARARRDRFRREGRCVGCGGETGGGFKCCAKHRTRRFA